MWLLIVTVVVWFCDCGSSVRMSFCAAQRSGAAVAVLRISAASSGSRQGINFMAGSLVLEPGCYAVPETDMR